jgi:hypothetical protein
VLLLALLVPGAALGLSMNQPAQASVSPIEAPTPMAWISRADRT